MSCSGPGPSLGLMQVLDVGLAAAGAGAGPCRREAVDGEARRGGSVLIGEPEEPQQHQVQGQVDQSDTYGNK